MLGSVPSVINCTTAPDSSFFTLISSLFPLPSSLFPLPSSLFPQEDHGEVSLLVSYQAFRLGGGAYLIQYVEVGTCPQLLCPLLCLVVYGGKDHGSAHILYVGRDGEAEEQHLHDGHAEEDEHCALVAQDVACLFYYERYKLFHLIFPIFPSYILVDCLARWVNTLSMSGWCNVRFR